MENVENERPPLTKEEKKAVEKHLKEVRRQLYKNLCKAYRGWWYWHCTLKKYKKQNIAQSAVVLLPGSDERDNYLTLLYLDRMLKQHKFAKALILTHSDVVKANAGLFSGNILDIVDCPRKKAEELMQFYCLYNFDKRFFCASLDEPYGRNGSRMIGAKGISPEEIFAIGVYRIYPYIKQEPPKPKPPQEFSPEINEWLKRCDKAAAEGYEPWDDPALENMPRE
jgi:hypothetical protein